MMDPATELKDRIANLIDEHWHQRSEPLLLSQLGAADHGEVGRLAKAQSGSLAAFMEHNVADRVRIVRGSTNPLVFAAVPASIDVNVEVDDLLERVRDHAATGGPRFHPAFWAAFRVPLDDGNRRFVSTRTPIRFEDLQSLTEGQPAGYVELDRRYIAAAECDAGGVQQLIADWLCHCGLDAKTYLVASNAASELPKNDLLGRLLMALDTDDLERVTMPLSVIDKLRRQAV